MKAVILAGGRGTRISEESDARPKPMIEIGGKPILWHVMKIYSAAGVNEFVVCLGYRGYMIKEYFANYFLHTSDVTIDVAENRMEVHARNAEPWRVTLVDTGSETMTGGRIRRIRRYVEDGPFCMTYGDGVTDLNVRSVIDFHQRRGKAATVTAIQPQGRYGSVNVEGESGLVTDFEEKPKGDGRWVNAGFFVLTPKVFDFIADDSTVWERDPLESLARQGELNAYRHAGFWHAMDTLRDKAHLEQLWSSATAPWKLWSDP
jgi:glucose-1-phosphate cytidylyltransferase